MAATTRRSKSVTIQPTIVNTASSFLEDLPAKPKENFSLREAVDQLRDPLKSALGKGYSYQDLALMLRDKGIEISASTLKNYVPSGKRQTAKAKAVAVKPTRGKKTSAPKTSETMSKIASAEDDLPATNGAAAEPPKPRGRRGAAKATAPDEAAAAPKTKAPRATKAATKAPTSRGRKKAV